MAGQEPTRDHRRRVVQDRDQETRNGSVRTVAERMIARHGDALFATACRYTVSREDAEDAYQRALEILLAKAPAIPEEELLPWTKTVVKHEAFAIWRSRDRTVLPGDEPFETARSAGPTPEEQAERYEQLRIGAEAIGRLKPQEVRCLLLRAEGLSYRQICEVTGWTYTKVNRCLTEGRRSFLERVAGIESGAECERLAPLLSRLADGEAGPDELTTLRPHLRSCMACRATLREYRYVPEDAAALVPAASAGGGDELTAALPRWAEQVVAWAQERAAVLGVKVHAAVEGATTGKLAAVAASTAALAGGTVAVRSLEDRSTGRSPSLAEAGDGVLERAVPAALIPAIPSAPEPPAALPEPEPAPVPPSPAPTLPEIPPEPAPPPEPQVAPVVLPEAVTTPVPTGEEAAERRRTRRAAIDPMTVPAGEPAPQRTTTTAPGTTETGTQAPTEPGTTTGAPAESGA